MKLSIVIPAYNEERRIKPSICQVLSFIQKLDRETEIIVVNDGSRDKTAEILESFEDTIRIINVYPNKGKGNAVKEGMLAATGDFVLFMDVDLATPLSEVARFYQLANKGHTEIVIGLRDLHQRNVRRTFLRAIASKMFKFFTNAFMSLGVRDSQCGFKMFPRQTIPLIFNLTKIERWSFDLEIIFLARKYKVKIVEIPVEWQEMGKSKMRLWWDAFVMLRDIFMIKYYNFAGYYNLSPEIGERYYELFQRSK